MVKQRFDNKKYLIMSYEASLQTLILGRRNGMSHAGAFSMVPKPRAGPRSDFPIFYYF